MKILFDYNKYSPKDESKVEYKCSAEGKGDSTPSESIDECYKFKVRDMIKTLVEREIAITYITAEIKKR